MKIIGIIKEDMREKCGNNWCDAGGIACQMSQSCPSSGGGKSEKKYCKKCYCVQCTRAVCRPSLPDDWKILGRSI